MAYSPTDTIFDFRVAEVAPERVQAWQERAEFLLDEASAGAASHQAADEEVLREGWNREASLGTLPTRTSTTNGRRQSPPVERAHDLGDELGDPVNAVNGSGNGNGSGAAHSPQERTDFGQLRSEISGLLDVTPEQIRVFPEAELPAITHRPAPSAPAPSPAYPQPVQAKTPGQAKPTVQEEKPRTAFVNSSQQSRYLHTPSDNPPAQAESLLNRPAPALGKVPAPATPPVSLTAGQIRFLDEEISELHGEVKRVLAARRDVTGHALSLLREAREILLVEPHRLGRAEYNIVQVRAMLERADEGRRQSSRRGFRVLLYLSLWLAGTAGAGVALFLYAGELSRAAGVLFGSGSRVVAHLLPFLWVIITGSAGAVVGAILGFLAHIRSGQDFDRQHVVRFAIQPIMGVILGVILYVLFSALFAAMQIDITERAITRGLPIILALPVGLWQEWIYASIYRMLGFFTLRPRRR